VGLAPLAEKVGPEEEDLFEDAEPETEPEAETGEEAPEEEG